MAQQAILDAHTRAFLKLLKNASHLHHSELRANVPVPQVDDTMRLMDLPPEMILIIKNHYLNEEHTRNPERGEFKTDANGEFVPNEKYDPRSKQGLPIVWKLVCKSTQATLPCNVESPLIAGCGSVDMLEWIRRDWNGGYDDSCKNAKLLALIIDGNNDTLQHSLAASPPEWLSNNSYKNIGEAAVKGALHNVLEWLCDHFLSGEDLLILASFAIRDGNNGIPTIKWIVEKGKRSYEWNEDDVWVHHVFCQAIMYNDCPDVVEAVHKARGQCSYESYESDEKTNAYENIAAMTEDYDDDTVLVDEYCEGGGAFPDLGSKRARKQQDTHAVQQLVYAGPHAWDTSNYGNNCGRISYGPIYENVCPLAAKHGHLDTLKRLESLGYELNKGVMMEAVIAGHFQDGGVAEWADGHPEARCSVKDMLSACLWSKERERERDYHIEQHMNMSAYQHLVHHTRERAQKDKQQAMAEAEEARQATARAADEARAADRARFLRQTARAYENKRRREEEIEANTLEIVLTVPEGTPIGLSRRGGSCEVAGVLPGSHAELAGLKPEYRILEVQGAVADGNNVRQLLAKRTTNGFMKLKVRRPAGNWTTPSVLPGNGL